MLVPSEVDRLAFPEHDDSFTRFAAADLGEPDRILDGSEQLEILAEAEVGELRVCRQRHALELDHDLHARPPRQVGSVPLDSVRDVQQRVRVRGEAAALLEAQRWTEVMAAAKRGAGPTERTGDDEAVAGARSTAARHAFRATERSDAEQ